MLGPAANVLSAQSAEIHYTRTGRISKMRKGRRVHDCKCGRASSIHFHSASLVSMVSKLDKHGAIRGLVQNRFVLQRFFSY